jgi:DNA-binding response OmpR family regulator
MKALLKEAPEAAILDIELTDGASTGLARALRLADVPFVVVSGITTSAPPPEFAGVEWIEKPADNRRLRPLLDAARARALLRGVFAPDAPEARDNAAAATA